MFCKFMDFAQGDTFFFSDEEWNELEELVTGRSTTKKQIIDIINYSSKHPEAKEKMAQLLYSLQSKPEYSSEIKNLIRSIRNRIFLKHNPREVKTAVAKANEEARKELDRRTPKNLAQRAVQPDNKDKKRNIIDEINQQQKNIATNIKNKNDLKTQNKETKKEIKLTEIVDPEAAALRNSIVATYNKVHEPIEQHIKSLKIEDVGKILKAIRDIRALETFFTEKLNSFERSFNAIDKTYQTAKKEMELLSAEYLLNNLELNPDYNGMLENIFLKAAEAHNQFKTELFKIVHQQERALLVNSAKQSIQKFIQDQYPGEEVSIDRILLEPEYKKEYTMQNSEDHYYLSIEISRHVSKDQIRKEKIYSKESNLGYIQKIRLLNAQISGYINKNTRENDHNSEYREISILLAQNP